MKTNTIRIFAVVMVMLFAFTLVTCVDQTVKYKQKAELLSLTIGGVGIETIPKPITAAEWGSETFGLAGAEFGRASFNTEVDTTEARIIAGVNKGSKAEWGIATRGTRPGFFEDIRVPATFHNEDYIYIKVTSDDNETISYYRVYTRLKAFVTDLNSISINTVRVGKAVDGEPEWDKPELDSSEISITIGEAQSALVEAVTYDPNATVRYAAIREASAEEPIFSAPDVPLVLDDQDTLYVEVTAENTIDKSFFKFRVDVGRMATIGSLKFHGNKEQEIYGKGLPNDDWNNVTAGSFSTAKGDQPSGGFGIIIEKDEPLATLDYVYLPGGSLGEPSFSGSNPATITFNSNDSLAIRVKAPNGGVSLYYRIKITLLAGNIVEHPKSGWYMRGATAAPLSVVLDPPDTGQYSYKWYEADSWYGVYGRHGYTVDEKANVSCVNGGPGQYFYLVQPDVIPSGGPLNTAQADEPFAWTVGTGTTYTPLTNWVDAGPPGVTANTKPDVVPTPPNVYFLQGSTNETRYYWVEITDNNTGLTVVSDRAVIITETDANTEHFIFELSILPRKNLIPFIEKGELYQIDLTDYPFPDGFDPSKYEICIVHAQYFLPDGRPWTQNWTHGDLHFGYTEGSASYRTNGGPLTWWHNNMGANSGSVPLQAPHAAQGGLLLKPDWVGFAPSGDPAKGIPPPDPITGDLPKGIYSMDAKDPYPAGVAQGYFAGFIELLELRFQTAPAK